MALLLMNPEWEDHQEVLKYLRDSGVEPTVVPSRGIDEPELVDEGQRAIGFHAIRRWLERRTLGA